MNYTTLFFDLDDTIYPAASGLWTAIRGRIGQYMHERLGIPADRVGDLRRQYFEQYGTALRGIEANYRVDREDYLAYVHNVRLADFIGPDPGLRAALEALPARKLIFTNADAAHALRVMDVVGVRECFSGIVDINAMAPHCKPERAAFEAALRLAGESDPRRCVMIDDLPRTTKAAREVGMFSILFGADAPAADADAALKDWQQLGDALTRGNSYTLQT